MLFISKSIGWNYRNSKSFYRIFIGKFEVIDMYYMCNGMDVCWRFFLFNVGFCLIFFEVTVIFQTTPETFANSLELIRLVHQWEFCISLVVYFCFVFFTRFLLCLFVAASHQTRLDTRSKARRPIKVEGKVGNEPRLEPCWSMLLIGSLNAMWPWWGKQFHEPKCGSGHVCRVMAWTRQQGLVPYIGFEKVRLLGSSSVLQ